jgi:SAM-dependent methyltransferase
MTSPASPPLYEQDPLSRFSNRAEDYAKYRPRYPQEAIATILEGLGKPSHLVIADVGAGTGISARLFADQGVRVWAIEPNADMRAMAQSHPRVEFREGTAEQTGLLDQSVDAIACCQAFHWFEPVATLREFKRILKPGGRVALMWNERNTEDPFTAACEQIIRAATDDDFMELRDAKSADALAHHPLFTHFRSYTFTHSHVLTLEGLLGLVLSSSYVPKVGAAYQQMLTDLKALYVSWTQETSSRATQSAISLSYHTELYLAESQLNGESIL